MKDFHSVDNSLLFLNTYKKIFQFQQVWKFFVIVHSAEVSHLELSLYCSEWNQ